MAILSRRSLQTLLDGSARFSTPTKIGDQIGRLRKGDHSALAAEWELIVMNGLANVIPVEHEIGEDGSRNLDVGFTLSSGTQIVADIVAVSDETYEEDNPTGPLVEELLKRLRKRGISGTIAIVIDDAVPREAIEKLRPRQSLSLPLQHEFASRIFDTAFDAFLDQIATKRSLEHRHRVTNPETSIEIVYSPGHSSCLIRHRPYAIPRDPIRNPVYKALDGKREQIKRDNRKRARDDPQKIHSHVTLVRVGGIRLLSEPAVAAALRGCVCPGQQIGRPAVYQIRCDPR